MKYFQAHTDPIGGDFPLRSTQDQAMEDLLDYLGISCLEMYGEAGVGPWYCKEYPVGIAVIHI